MYGRAKQAELKKNKAQQCKTNSLKKMKVQNMKSKVK